MHLLMLILICLYGPPVNGVDHAVRRAGQSTSTSAEQAWLDEIVDTLDDSLSDAVSEVLKRQGMAPTRANVRQTISALVALRMEAKMPESFEQVADNPDLKGLLEIMDRVIKAAS